MSNFVENNTTLPAVKTGTGASAIGNSEFVSAADYNAIRQALIDLRGAIQGDRTAEAGEQAIADVVTATESLVAVSVAMAVTGALTLSSNLTTGGSLKRKLTAVADSAATAGAAQALPVDCTRTVAIGGIVRAAAVQVATSAIGGLVRSTNVVTATTAAAHGFETGETATLTPGEAGFAAGAFVVTKINATSFSYSQAGDDGASEAPQGWTAPRTVTVTKAAHGLHAGDVVTLAPGEAQFAAAAYTILTTPTTGTFTYRDPAGTVSASASEQVFNCDHVVTLPTAVGNAGLDYAIKKVDATASTVTVDGAASETIEGAANKVLTAQWDFVHVVSDGAQWLLFDKIVTP